MNTIWFLSCTLCFVKLLVMFCLIACSLDFTSLRAFWISEERLSEKSRFSRELRGTTGWSKWFEFKHLLQILTWSFRQNKIKSSEWFSQTRGS